MDEISRLLRDQGGVVARRQLLDLEGVDRVGVARMLRRRDLNEVHRGVYVDHTGPLDWPRRAWAAVRRVDSRSADLVGVRVGLR